MADKSGPARKKYFTNFDDADEFIADLQKDVGRQIYFCCATFVDNTKPQGAANVSELKSFYIDVDCGPTKPYKNKGEGLKAIRTFCKEVGLPIPTLVDSGNGIHGYWILEEAVDYNRWKPVGESLKKKTHELGFHVDHSVTGDAAQILRVPDTFNTKDINNPKEIKIVHSAPPISYAEFIKVIPPVLDHSAFNRLPPDELTKNLMGGEYPTSLFDKILKKCYRTEMVKEKIKIVTTDPHGNEDFHFKDKIVERSSGCPQLQFCYENRATLEEPMWWAALSIARRCTDWEDAIVKVSIDHPDYTFENSLDKADRTIGARRCDEFQKLRPEGCMGCMHRGKITSPIQLGTYVELAQPEDNILENQWHEGLNTVTTIEAPTAYPWPWVRPKKGGVARIDMVDATAAEDNKIDNPEPISVYDNDLWVVKRLIDPKEGMKVHMVLVRPKEGVIEFTVPMTHMTKKDKCQEVLSFHGVNVIGTKLGLLQQYIMAWIGKLEKEVEADRARMQFGWHDNDQCFVVGNREIRGSGNIVYSPPSSATSEVAPLYTAHGDLDKWKEVANLYNNPGNEVRAFVLFAGFGAPLYKFLNEGSMMIHLTNSASGVGKTTAQRMANSVWGNPKTTLLNNNDKPLARQHRFGVLQHLPVVTDEITNTDPEEMSNSLLDFSHDRGRNRMQSQSNSERENLTTWSTIGITSGNNSGVDTVKQHRGSVEGEMYRLLELVVEADTNLTKEQSDYYYNEVLPDNYGLAGEVFIGYVVDNLTDVKKRLKEVRKEFDSLAGFKQKERYYSACCAAVFTAAEIAVKLDLVDIDVERLKAWAVRTLGVIKANVKEASAEDSVAVLGRFLNEHQRNILIIKKESDPSFNSVPIKEVTGDLVLRFEVDKDSPQLYIAKTALENWCSANRIPVSGFYKSLERNGLILSLNHRKRLAEGTNTPGLPVPTVWIDAARLKSDQLGFDTSSNIH